MLDDNVSPADAMKALGIESVDDSDLEALCKELLEANPEDRCRRAIRQTTGYWSVDWTSEEEEPERKSRQGSADVSRLNFEDVRTMSEFKTIAKVGSIEEGSGRAFPLDGKMIAVFNDGGTYRAIDDFCPHMGASLADGHLEDGIVACPWHAWRFNTCDGTWCDNPKLKINAYAVRVEGNDIQVRLENTDSTATEASCDEQQKPSTDDGNNA